jgi:hypothetical protein
MVDSEVGDPTCVGRALATYEILIEGREERLAATARGLAWGVNGCLRGSGTAFQLRDSRPASVRVEVHHLVDRI